MEKYLSFATQISTRSCRSIRFTASVRRQRVDGSLYRSFSLCISGEAETGSAREKHGPLDSCHEHRSSSLSLSRFHPISRISSTFQRGVDPHGDWTWRYRVSMIEKSKNRAHWTSSLTETPVSTREYPPVSTIVISVYGVLGQWLFVVR